MLRSLALATIATLSLGSFGSLSAADTYKLDEVHSVALFKVGHLGISNTWGRFNKVEGTLTWDADVSKAALAITVAIDSVDTFNEKRDQHLKSPDFFNAKQFPTATFVSKSWKATGEKTYEVTGDFTLLGTTKSVTLPVTMVGAGATPFKDVRAGFDAQLSFKRSDFGMKDKLEFAGDDVTLFIAIEGIKQ
jgi:polyisoprenoid-binding protein YceI